LRQTLGPFYTSSAESDSPDVLVRLRRYGTTDYLFALNDKRTFGDYVGQFGLVMEKGLPQNATLTVRRPSSAVYDLVAHRQVESLSEDGVTKIKAAFGPGGGRVYMITDAIISAVTVTGKRRISRGQTLHLDIAVVDRGGDPVKAVVPVRVAVRDPRGETGEFSGYYAAKDGRLRISLDMAPNDALGEWTVEVEELASSQRTQRVFEFVP